MFRAAECEFSGTEAAVLVMVLSCVTPDRCIMLLHQPWWSLMY